MPTQTTSSYDRLVADIRLVNERDAWQAVHTRLLALFDEAIPAINESNISALRVAAEFLNPPRAKKWQLWLADEIRDEPQGILVREAIRQVAEKLRDAEAVLRTAAEGGRQ